MNEIKLKNGIYEIAILLPILLGSKTLLIENTIDFEISGFSISIKFISPEIYNMLKKWFDILHTGELYHKMDIIGEIIIYQVDRTGLILSTTRFISSQITMLNNGDIAGAKFIWDDRIDDHTGFVPSFKGTTGPIGIQGHEDPNGFQKMKSLCEVGYHTAVINKGVLGEISKIEEELNELKDAENQGSKIMMMVELSDLYGSIEEYAIKNAVTMEDIKTFSDITKRAFKNGERK